MKRVYKTSWGNLLGYIELSPLSLIEKFGAPCESDGFKVSGEFTFQLGDDIFYVYDWKSTSLYDEDYPSPSELWNTKGLYEFHIGGVDGKNLEKFKAALLKELRDEK